MYAFKYEVTYEEMQKVLGVKPTEFTEFKRKLIFLDGKKIIHEEEEKTNIENVVNNQVVFDIPDSLNYKCYSVNDAIFIAHKKMNGDIVYFDLKQVN